jgi:hypothetical protein
MRPCARCPRPVQIIHAAVDVNGVYAQARLARSSRRRVVVERGTSKEVTELPLPTRGRNHIYPSTRPIRSLIVSHRSCRFPRRHPGSRRASRPAHQNRGWFTCAKWKAGSTANGRSCGLSTFPLQSVAASTACSTHAHDVSAGARPPVEQLNQDYRVQQRTQELGASTGAAGEQPPAQYATSTGQCSHGLARPEKPITNIEGEPPRPARPLWQRCSTTTLSATCR